ncbi:tyrosine-type recombinase/integrase [Nocardiopsis sp. M1B1]|uniref:tyrosine-type recombinase/integrase n=1 Tax=Nocardiopsis sp. M1B1 TaxID=3450454 RepID=UPI00403A7952
MATINQRTLADGRTRYWVKWRLGGTRTGAPQSEPFDTHADAHTFKLHVEAAGHQWPENWIRRQGWAPGWVPGHGWVRSDEEDDEPEAEPVLFADYARDLVNSMTGIEERTRADYHRDLAIHLIPRFGRANLRDPAQLKPKDVRAWINHLRTGVPDPAAPYRTNTPSRGRKKEPGWLRKPLSPKSIHNLHGLLFTVCEAAVREDPPLRPSNPASRTRLPRIDDGEGEADMCFLTREEFALLRDSMAEDVRDMVEVFVRTGMRYSELVALQVRDITLTPAIGPDGQPLTRGHLDVRRAWKRCLDNTFRLGAPKTRSSRRRIPLSPGTIDLLRPRLEGKGPEEFVFTTDRGSWWRHSSFYGRRWAPGVKEAQRRGLGKKPRIHDLRHTHVAWLIDKDVHVFKIQRRLGHTSITTTMDRYGHLVTDIDDTMIEAIDGPPAGSAPWTDPGDEQRLRLIS